LFGKSAFKENDKRKNFQGSNAVGRLSKTLLKTLGGDKKSIETHHPEPLTKWMTRKNS
jgi:hypothetical protein